MTSAYLVDQVFTSSGHHLPLAPRAEAGAPAADADGVDGAAAVGAGVAGLAGDGPGVQLCRRVGPAAGAALVVQGHGGAEGGHDAVAQPGDFIAGQVRSGA